MVEKDGCHDGSTDECSDGIHRKSSFEAWHSSNEIADQCQSGTSEGGGWHQYSIIVCSPKCPT